MQNQNKDTITEVTAGFYVRACAYITDVVLVGFLTFGLKFIVWMLKLGDADSIIWTDLLFSYDIAEIIFYLIPVLYMAVSVAFTGTTLGKWLLKLKVISVDSEKEKPGFFAMLYRESIGRFLSSIMGIGYLMIAFDKEHRALHDILSDTRVIYSCPMRVVGKPVVANAASVPGTGKEADNIQASTTADVTKSAEEKVVKATTEATTTTRKKTIQRMDYYQIPDELLTIEINDIEKQNTPAIESGSLNELGDGVGRLEGTEEGILDSQIASIQTVANEDLLEESPFSGTLESQPEDTTNE